jgi:hypothetical protein
MKKILFAFWVLAIFVACSCSKSENDIKKVPSVDIQDSTDVHYIKDL